MRPVVRLGLVGASFLAVGCYELQPARGNAPQLGNLMGFDITDAGRVALGGSMGPEISQIEGRLVSKDNGEYVIAVTTLHVLRGADQVWHGEQVHVKTEYVSTLYERRLSPARTVAMGAAGLGAIAVIATRSLLGNTTTERPGPSPGDTGHTQRIPRR
ncbi:MAG: hypothetical protein ACREPM_17700 [Gemmatimonadaceae bacterium]